MFLSVAPFTHFFFFLPDFCVEHGADHPADCRPIRDVKGVREYKACVVTEAETDRQGHLTPVNMLQTAVGVLHENFVFSHLHAASATKSCLHMEIPEIKFIIEQ